VRWRPAHVDAAIVGLAALHARWCGRTAPLAGASWLSPVRRTADVLEMEPLWIALAEHAAPLFATHAGTGLPPLHRQVIDDIARWRAAADALPQTLIHNDFNPRNVRVRRTAAGWQACAFDWELATLGAPTRDLAELLCFVCPSDTPQPRVERWIDAHRIELCRRAGVVIDATQWRHAFAASLCELLIDRLAVYALVHRVRPQPFLPRVLRTWTVLFRTFGDPSAR
jgi:hypothetical protein